VGVRLYDRITKLTRVSQRYTTRYDLQVEPDAVPRVLRKLWNQKHRAGWHVREHACRCRRRKTVRGQSQNRKPEPNLIATWNVHGLKPKRTEVEYFMRKEGVAVLALQETLRGVDDWRLRLGAYQCIEAPCKPGVPGKRGVALAVAPNLICHEIGTRSDNWVWAKVYKPGAKLRPWIIGSVYIPAHAGPNRREVIKQLRDSVKEIRRKHPECAVVIMGDWNMDLSTLSGEVMSWNLGMVPVKCRGSRRTRWRGHGRWRDLDHMVVSENATEELSSVTVNRAWDISDHWPVQCKMKPSKVVHVREHLKELPRMDPEKVRNRAQQIASHNYWQPLADLVDACEDQCTVESLTAEFTKVSEQVAKDVGVLKVARAKSRKGSGINLSRETRRSIDQRRKIYSRWRAEQDASAKERLWEQYREARKASHKAVRGERRTNWLKYVADGAEALSSGRWHEAWRWIKRTCGKGRNPNGVQPVKDPNGELQVDALSVANAWAQHYAELAEDKTGHSRQASHWSRKRVRWEAAIDEVNAPIKWPELNSRLLELKGRKAPGKDGLTSEWFKSMAEPPETMGEFPESPMGKVFLRLVQGMWENSHIPATWNEATVVSVPKKGDPTLMDNYRGISLMAVGLKVLCALVIRRVKASLEERGLLCREQAGFRSREECMGQVIALHEITRRRQILGLPTYAAFIDFKKAYDTVPQEALMRKLECIGIRGKALKFISSLYEDSRARVRVGRQMSRSFQLERGVRQGCPMSPILFDVFINDILRGCEGNGVEIPGSEDGKVAGLLFADDLVLIAPTTAKLRASMRKVEMWAERWEMQFGVAKCGVTTFGSDPTELRGLRWTLQGEPVPVVDKYVYLGIELNSELNLETTSEAITARTRKVVWGLKPFLSNRNIPLAIRVLAIKSLVIPVATMGSELLGMNQKLHIERQKMINQATSWMYSGDRGGTGVLTTTTMGLEIKLAPLSAIASGRRARAWAKFPSLKTWMAALVGMPFTNRSRTWVTGTKWWLARLKDSEIPESAIPESAGGYGKKVTDSEWSRLRSVKKPKSLSWYEKCAFKQTRGFIHQGARFPEVTRGIEWLSRMRMQAVWTAPRAAKAKLIPLTWRHRCPRCLIETDENIPHILIECRAETESRRMIAPIMERAVEQLPAGSEQVAVATLILGGRVGGASLGQRWLERTTQGEDEVDPDFVLVSRFLQEVMPRRMGRLWSLWMPQRSDNVEVVIPQLDQRADAQVGYGRPAPSRTRRNQGGFSGVQIPTLPVTRETFVCVEIPVMETQMEWTA